MELKIHRGAKEIGGSCVELKTSTGRLILDLGLPLTNPDGSSFKLPRGARAEALLEAGILPRIEGLYDGKYSDSLSLVISHAHQDHYGLASFVHSSIPIYASAGTKALLDVMRIFLGFKIDTGRIKELRARKTELIHGFKVTPYAVCHSAPDGLALLVDADQKRVFYTGDFRGHGRRSYLHESLIKNPPQNIDVMLMEGTTLGRTEKSRFATESDVEEEFVRLFRNRSNAALVFASGQNLDRLISLYRAAKRTDSTLVLDPYTAYVLYRLRILSKRIPQSDWSNIRVLKWGNHIEKLEAVGEHDFVEKLRMKRIQLSDLKAYRRRMVCVLRTSIFSKLQKHFAPEGLQVIWSQWSGYWPKNIDVRPYCDSNSLTPLFVHSGGHANLKALTDLASRLRPRTLIPIHTQLPAAYRSIYRHTRLVDDNELVLLD